MDDAVGYRERRAHRVPAVLWRRDCGAGQSLVLPDGCMDVITEGERVWVAGPDTRPHLHRTGTRQTLTAIRFAPGIAPIVLGVPGAEVRDSRPDLGDLGDAVLNRWGAEIVGSASPAAALEAWAGERFLRAGGAPGWIDVVLRELRRGSTVAGVADALGLTSRALHRRCLRHFGYGPKTVQRILRVNAATRAVRDGAPLSDVAHAHGFADYAHMFRDFRSVTGESPARMRDPGRQGRAAKRSTGAPSGSRTTA